MIPFAGQKHSHSDTNIVDDELRKRRLDEFNNLMQHDCVIFVTKNYILDNPNVAYALSRRYREVRNKEFICKPCHTKLQHGHFSKVNSIEVEHSKMY